MPLDEGKTDELKKKMEEQREDLLKGQMGKKEEPQYEPLVGFTVKAEHTVAGGENLSAISEKYYKTQANWLLIYRANMEVIGDNPNVIRPGMELKIPAV
jgi:nucleoid-associated protein YgaU